MTDEMHQTLPLTKSNQLKCAAGSFREHLLHDFLGGLSELVTCQIKRMLNHLPPPLPLLEWLTLERGRQLGYVTLKSTSVYFFLLGN